VCNDNDGSGTKRKAVQSCRAKQSWYVRRRHEKFRLRVADKKILGAFIWES
jgi:hypothetical protein